MEHDLPRLADHAQTGGRLLGGKLRAPAIEGVNAPMFEFAPSILNSIEVVVHQAEEDAPDHEAETGKGGHGSGLVKAVTSLAFELAALFQRAAAQQFAQAMAGGSRLHRVFQWSEPLRKLRRRLCPQNWSEDLN